MKLSCDQSARLWNAADVRQVEVLAEDVVVIPEKKLGRFASMGQAHFSVSGGDSAEISHIRLRFLTSFRC